MTREEIIKINSLLDKSRHCEGNYKELCKLSNMLKNSDEDMFSRRICEMTLTARDNNDSEYDVRIPKELYETMILMLSNHYENMFRRYEKEISEFQPEVKF